MSHVIIIGYGDYPIAAVPSVEYGIAKVKEWNPDSIFITNIDNENIHGRTLIMQKTPLKMIHWWYKELKSYL